MFTPARLSLLTGFVFTAGLLSAAEPLPFPNPGFESGFESWTVDKNDQAAGLSQVKAEAARTGKSGLRVTQKDGSPGSWIQSARIPAIDAQTYRLEFWSRVVSTSGIGVWVQFYDVERKPLKPAGGDPAVQLLPDPADWTRQQLNFTPPVGTEYVSVAVHGYSKRPVLADFDDFTLTPIEASASNTASAAAPSALGAPNALTPDPARVKQIASYLPAKPKGLGPTLADRAIWDALKSDPETSGKMIERAARFMNEPTPAITAEAYQASVQSGDRKIDNVTSHRRFRLTTLMIAEGMENQGRFIPSIEKETAAICDETTWIMSGHVQFSTNRNDLGTAMTAWNLAAVDTMLGDKLSAGLRKTIRDRVRERLLVHYLAAIRGETKLEWWSTDLNNWNSVVHGGIVGAALALDDSVEERAEIVAAAELGTQFYIKGFPADGYSPEGMGYWKYGFGHYVLLSEAVLAATKGKVNFYDRDNIRLVAQFPRRFEMQAGLYPAYGDALLAEVPSAWLFHLIDRRYGLNDGSARALYPDPTYSAFLYSYGAILCFDSKAAPVTGKSTVSLPDHALRDWFEQSQIYVGRPASGAIAVSFKGSNNGVSHGHNDLGTFVVATGGEPVITDPGVPIYNARTMGPNAFDYQVKSSYGHSVPFVAGQPQKRGSQYAATVKDKKFTDSLDSVTLDLAAGYGLPSVKELTRRFDYSRVGKGGFMITDRVAFTSPQAFGTALTTYGEAREEKPGVWLITYKGKSLRAEITTSGNLPFTVTDEVLKDESRQGKVRRLGINLNSPAADATIAIKITSAP
ncbi:MAG TPA: heparinase II/III family protein [Rariglobus sp.]|nr:heparinase II/III family protein [Rariglobus sp.]